MKTKKKNFDYFETLTIMSGFAVTEAEYLKQMVVNYNPEELDVHREHMHELEHKCDMVKHDLTTALIKDFLPPVDRDDLFKLSHITDNLTDSVESVVAFFYMADIRAMRTDVVEFVDLVIECCKNAEELLREFKNFKKPEKLKQYIIALNDLEEKGDRMYADAVRKLSREENISTRDLIEWRDVYRNFETVYDSAESIADNIESVVLKNS